jgi:predicted TIM-barrel fold metal-dependent hydrolase
MMRMDETIPFTAGTAPPRMAIPVGAVDCHHHVYEDAFAPVPGARAHAPATLADYARLRARLGFSRNVLVQPSTYGFDNTLHLRAAAELGEAARLVVVVPPDAPAAELRRMREAGARGARANLVQGIPLSAADVAPLGRRMAEQGWHLQIYAGAAQIAELGPVLRALPCPVVFDHFAQLPLRDWQSHPAWRVVMDLLQAGRAHIKLSSPYGLDQDDPAAVGPLARALVAAAPERMLWGTNWPHPNAQTIPDDAALLDLLAEWAPAEATRRAILVDNPMALYDFRA